MVLVQFVVFMIPMSFETLINMKQQSVRSCGACRTRTLTVTYEQYLVGRTSSRNAINVAALASRHLDLTKKNPHVEECFMPNWNALAKAPGLYLSHRIRWFESWYQLFIIRFKIDIILWRNK